MIMYVFMYIRNMVLNFFQMCCYLKKFIITCFFSEFTTPYVIIKGGNIYGYIILLKNTFNFANKIVKFCVF